LLALQDEHYKAVYKDLIPPKDLLLVSNKQVLSKLQNVKPISIIQYLLHRR